MKSKFNFLLMYNGSKWRYFLQDFIPTHTLPYNILYFIQLYIRAFVISQFEFNPSGSMQYLDDNYGSRT